MIDNKTQRLKLPLPHVENYLEDDVQRLTDSLTILDNAATVGEDGKIPAEQLPDAPVTSVNGQTGGVELDADDVGADTPWETDTANSGVINAAAKVRWLVDTTAARTRTLGNGVIEFVVKDISGMAGTNAITLTAPAGKTINGASSETIDANFGWAHYVLAGADFKIIGGQ